MEAAASAAGSVIVREGGLDAHGSSAQSNGPGKGLATGSESPLYSRSTNAGPSAVVPKPRFGSVRGLFPVKPEPTTRPIRRPDENERGADAPL